MQDDEEEEEEQADSVKEAEIPDQNQEPLLGIPLKKRRKRNRKRKKKSQLPTDETAAEVTTRDGEATAVSITEESMMGENIQDQQQLRPEVQEVNYLGFEIITNEEARSLRNRLAPIVTSQIQQQNLRHSTQSAHEELPAEESVVTDTLQIESESAPTEFTIESLEDRISEQLHAFQPDEEKDITNESEVSIEPEPYIKELVQEDLPSEGIKEAHIGATKPETDVEVVPSEKAMDYSLLADVLLEDPKSTVTHITELDILSESSQIEEKNSEEPITLVTGLPDEVVEESASAPDQHVVSTEPETSLLETTPTEIPDHPLLNEEISVKQYETEDERPIEYFETEMSVVPVAADTKESEDTIEKPAATEMEKSGELTTVPDKEVATEEVSSSMKIQPKLWDDVALPEEKKLREPETVTVTGPTIDEGTVEIAQIVEQEQKTVPKEDGKIHTRDIQEVSQRPAEFDSLPIAETTDEVEIDYEKALTEESAVQIKVDNIDDEISEAVSTLVIEPDKQVADLPEDAVLSEAESLTGVRENQIEKVEEEFPYEPKIMIEHAQDELIEYTDEKLIIPEKALTEKMPTDIISELEPVVDTTTLNLIEEQLLEMPKEQMEGPKDNNPPFGAESEPNTTENITEIPIREEQSAEIQSEPNLKIIQPAKSDGELHAEIHPKDVESVQDPGDEALKSEDQLQTVAFRSSVCTEHSEVRMVRDTKRKTISVDSCPEDIPITPKPLKVLAEEKVPKVTRDNGWLALSTVSSEHREVSLTMPSDVNTIEVKEVEVSEEASAGEEGKDKRSDRAGDREDSMAESKPPKSLIDGSYRKGKKKRKVRKKQVKAVSPPQSAEFRGILHEPETRPSPDEVSFLYSVFFFFFSIFLESKL